jgi:5-methylcytosine-specific restriction protein A
MFKGQPQLVAEEAARIRAFSDEIGASGGEPQLDPDEDLEFEEGRLVLRVHRSRERNRSAVRQKKARALDESGLICEACREDYTTKYAERGHGIIECHHRVPLSQLTPGKKPRLSDLALVCANCHRLVHCRQPWLEWHQLLALVAPPPSGPDS